MRAWPRSSPAACSNRISTVSAARRSCSSIPRREGKVTSIVGQGWAPKRRRCRLVSVARKTLEGAGLDPAVVPGALHAALTVLESWGTMTFAEVAAPASIRRSGGSPSAHTARAIRTSSSCSSAGRTTRRYWLKPDGSTYKPGETIKLPSTRAHAAAHGGSRARRKEAGPRGRHRRRRDRFYKGDIAPRDGRVSAEARRAVRRVGLRRVLRPRRGAGETTYRGYTVYKHGFGSQGPVLLQTLNILEKFDLRAMGYGSADYLHTVVEAMKLAYADRDTYYADPAFVKVPPKGSSRRPTRRSARRSIDPSARRRRSSPAIR